MSEAAAQTATAPAEAAPAAPAGPPKGRKVDVLEQFKAVEAAEKAKEAAPAPAAAAEPAKDGAAPAEPAAAEKKDKPNPADWKSFRTEQRAWRAKVNDYESKLAAREAAIAEREKSPDVLTKAQLKSMLESADLDGIAKACGANGWRELNDIGLKAFADPAYKQNQKMRAELDELKASREKAEKEAQEAAERHQRQQAEREYQQSLAAALRESASEPVKKLAADTDEGAMFTQFVFQKIADHYRETGEELEPDEAADEIIREVIQPRLARWNKIFGAPQTVTEEAASAAPAIRTAVTSAKTSKHVTRHAAKQAAPNGGRLSRAEWLEMAEQEMRKAQKTA
jgi:hypothetical protein